MIVPFIVARTRRPTRICLALTIALTSLGAFALQSGPSRIAHAQDAPVYTAQSALTPANQDLFGMVMRDPFYEFNTDPVNFPNAANKTALEEQAKELASAG